jgi:hypothetical protein
MNAVIWRAKICRRFCGLARWGRRIAPRLTALPVIPSRKSVTGRAAMESTIAASAQSQVIIGVDTHKQFHVAHACENFRY